MDTTHSEPADERLRAASQIGPLKVALLMVALIGGFYLLREHWNHVAGNWIYLLLLACSVMHLFHGHGSRGSAADKPRGKEG